MIGGLLTLLILPVLGLAARWSQRGAQNTPSPLLTSDDADTDAPSVDQVMFEAAKHLLDLQVSGADRLNDRIAGSFTTGSTVLPVTIGLLNLLRSAPIPTSAERSVIAALIAYGILIASALISYVFVPKVEVHPNVTTLRGHVASRAFDGAQLQLWVAEEYARAVMRNRGRLQVRGWFALATTVALYAEAILLSLAAYEALT